MFLGRCCGSAGVRAFSRGRSTAESHFLRLLFVFVLIVVVVVIFVLFSFLVRLCLFRIVLLFLLGFLMLAQSLPLLGEGVSFCNVVCDDHVVEDGPALHLPQIEADESEIGILVQIVIVLVLRIGDLFRLPDTLVCRVGNALHMPIAFVSGIVLHRGLPLTVFLIVPVIGLLRLLVDDPLLVGPIVGLLVLWVLDHAVVDPIGRLFVVGVR